MSATRYAALLKPERVTTVNSAYEQLVYFTSTNLLWTRNKAGFSEAFDRVTEEMFN